MSIQDPRGIGFGVCRLGGGSNFPSGKFKLLEFAVKFAKIGLGPPVKQNYPSDPSHLPKFIFFCIRTIETRDIEGAGETAVLCACVYCYI